MKKLPKKKRVDAIELKRLDGVKEDELKNKRYYYKFFFVNRTPATLLIKIHCEKKMAVFKFFDKFKIFKFPIHVSSIFKISFSIFFLNFKFDSSFQILHIILI